ncbi:hypothetical protein WJX73_006073 [Symbiochloris irregularis]|uniref:Uncharacterized protein n=1 Tax=Symbiochloris irregularis TaxID=706552 RepID=A0AAW1NPQ9_9CHLO
MAMLHRQNSRHHRAKGLREVQTSECPRPYERQSLEDIKSKVVRPYLFGGNREPCESCKEGEVGEFCQFKRPAEDKHWDFYHSAHICDPERKQLIVDWAIQQGFNDVLQFTPCDFWPLLKDRSLWLMGDSLMKDMWVAMVCFMREFWDLVITEKPGNADEEALAYLEEVTTRRPSDLALMLDAPLCAEFKAAGGSGRICFLKVNTAEEGISVAMPLLQHMARNTQPLVLFNFGLWHHRPLMLASSLKQLLTLLNTGNYPMMIWRDTSPQHFNTSDGLYIINDGELPYTCVPYKGVTLTSDHKLVGTADTSPGIMTGLWRNEVAATVIPPSMPNLLTWNDTAMMWNFHRSNIGKGWDVWCANLSPKPAARGHSVFSAQHRRIAGLQQGMSGGEGLAARPEALVAPSSRSHLRLLQGGLQGMPVSPCCSFPGPRMWLV